VSRRLEPHRVPLIALAAALAFGSGATDLASFTRLGGVFASVMTGNLVLLGLAITRTKGQDELWPVGVTECLAIELALLAVFTVGWELADAHPAGAWQLCLLAVGALAMGLQGAAVRSVRTSLRTTYLTSTLIGVVEEIVKSGRRGEGFSLNVTVLVAAAVGAAAGGAVIAIAPACLPVLPMGAVAAVVTFATIRGVR